MSDTENLTEDESPELDPATFDLDAWISGVTSTVRSVTLYQRADLLGQVDELERELRTIDDGDDEDRGINDRSKATVRRELEQIAREFEASALVVKVQGQADARREDIEKKLKKKGVTDQNEVVLHQLADAILEPKGMTVEVLRRLQERSEPQVKLLLVASANASFQPPKVDAPFSSGSSNERKRRG